MKIEKPSYTEELQVEFTIRKKESDYIIYQCHVLKSDPQVKSKTIKCFATKEQIRDLDSLSIEFPEFKEQLDSPGGYKSIIT